MLLLLLVFVVLVLLVLVVVVLVVLSVPLHYMRLHIVHLLLIPPLSVFLGA
jgi:hypothetical protein